MSRDKSKVRVMLMTEVQFGYRMGLLVC